MPTVFLHPIGLDAQMWHEVAGPGDLVLSFPGFGDTPLEGELTFERMAEFVAGHVTRPADLVGVSLGSMVAQHTALLRPDKVRSVLLACGASATDPETSRERARATRQTGMAGVLPSTLRRWFTARALAADGHPGVAYARKRLLADDPEVFAGYWEMMAGHDLTACLDAVTVPTTVLAASGDLATPAAAMKDMADRIPGARFEVIDGPHIVPLENRDAFADAVGRHLSEVRG